MTAFWFGFCFAAGFAVFGLVMVVVGSIALVIGGKMGDAHMRAKGRRRNA